MEIETKYGTFKVVETTTGLVAEHIASGTQYFLEGKWLPDLDHTMDVNSLIQHIEDEWEFMLDYK